MQSWNVKRHPLIFAYVLALSALPWDPNMGDEAGELVGLEYYIAIACVFINYANSLLSSIATGFVCTLFGDAVAQFLERKSSQLCSRWS